MYYIKFVHKYEIQQAVFKKLKNLLLYRKIEYFVDFTFFY
jgi:hypothetical protein